MPGAKKNSFRLWLDDNHFIGADPYNWILVEVIATKSGKQPGKEHTLARGYHSTIKDAVRLWVKRTLRQTPGDVQQILDAVDALNAKVDALPRVLDEHRGQIVAQS